MGKRADKHDPCALRRTVQLVTDRHRGEKTSAANWAMMETS